jgi:hypothetical protein
MLSVLFSSFRTFYQFWAILSIGSNNRLGGKFSSYPSIKILSLSAEALLGIEVAFYIFTLLSPPVDLYLSGMDFPRLSDPAITMFVAVWWTPGLPGLLTGSHLVLPWKGCWTRLDLGLQTIIYFILTFIIIIFSHHAKYKLTPLLTLKMNSFNPFDSRLKHPSRAGQLTETGVVLPAPDEVTPTRIYKLTLNA